jgi:ABC-2 type transport system ATP-binding protein
MQSAIRTERLSRRFGELSAVEDLTLSVAPGEIFGFLGPNGAGKTTTMRMLAALIAPTAGDGWINGRSVASDAEFVRGSVGILTETPGLYERLSALQNLELFGRLYDVPRLDPQMEKYLRLLELWDRRDDMVGTFSKGMRQKLALARALVHEPPVLLLDEPTSALDPASAHVVHDFIAELRRQGRTIFLCTHNLAEAEQLCDRIALFRRRLICVDTLEGLRRTRSAPTVRVQLREVRPEWVALLRELPGVREVTRHEQALLVELEDPAAQNPALVRALVQAGAEVQWIVEERRSLEQVYLELVGPMAEA